ncbi:MAG: aspartate kinase [Thermoproteota archaeon]|nr:aspartate kinase [Thermoproteota archaeon]
MTVFSAPKGLTDKIIGIGRNCAKGEFSEEYKSLINPYLKISEQHIQGSLKEHFEAGKKRHIDEVGKALERICLNREFEGVDRAIALAYGGELLTATMMSYILNSHHLEASSVPFSKWLVMTDRNFECDTFLLRESKERTDNLVKRIEDGKVLAIGGFI